MDLEESENQFKENSIVVEHFDNEEFASGSSVLNNLEDEQAIPKMIDKSIQTHLTESYRNKACQAEVELVNQTTSPLKPHRHSVSTFPFKIRHSFNRYPSRPRESASSEILNGDTSYAPSVTRPESSQSTKSLQIYSASLDCSKMLEDDKNQDALRILEYKKKLIMKKPFLYMGIPPSCDFLVNIIQKHTNIPITHIMLCLKKIRLNTSFTELADTFAMNRTYARKIFFKNIPLLASMMHPFLIKLNKEKITLNLPIAFRYKYHNVSCIINCIEIEVQKPSNALKQELTWSDNKKANTVKYLISCTPSGVVNYVSPGYGGRITDTCLVESCDFIKCLEPGMCVMADRRFKDVEGYLSKVGVLLVQPPSVVSGVKSTSMQAKQIRKHVELVIRRLEEFRMLKPGDFLKLNMVGVLDEVITIACGLINLQDRIY